MLSQRIIKLISCMLTMAILITSLGMVTIASATVSDDNILFDKDFSGGVTKDDADKFNKYAGNGGFRVVEGSQKTMYAQESANSLKLTTSVSSDYSGGFVWADCTAADKKPESLKLQGAVVFEAEMMFESLATGTEYYPLSIASDPESYVSTHFYANFTMNTIKVIGNEDGKGNVSIGGTSVGTIDAGKYYKFSITYCIDGNADTIDTFSASVTGENVSYSGSGNVSGFRWGDSTGKKLTSIYALHVLRANNGTSAAINAHVKTLKGYNLTPKFTSTLADGQTEVKEGSEITLTFSKVMDTDTFAGITLKDADGKTVSGLTVEAENDTTCVITLPEMLESNAAYSLVVPATVMSEDDISVVAATIGFTSAETKYIMFKDFSGGVSQADYQAMFDSYAGLDGFKTVSGAKIKSSATTENLKLVTDASSTDWQAGFVWAVGTSSAKPASLKLTGNVVFEAEMKFNDLASGVTYYPLTIAADPESYAHNTFYANFTLNTFKVVGGENNTGEVYINDSTKLCDIETGKFYKFKILYSIDGSTDTVDTFSAKISDGTNEYAGTGKVANFRWTSGWSGAGKKTDGSALESIYALHVLRASNSTTSTKTVEVKTIKGYKLVPATFEVGKTSEIGVADPIILTFSDVMNAEGFSGIVLKDSNGNTVDGVVKTPVSGNSNTCTITLPTGGLEYGATYTLSVPAIASKDGILSVARDVTLTTEEAVEPLEVSLECDAITAGASVQVAATFTNKTNVAQTACLIIALYDGEGKLHNVLILDDTEIAVGGHEDLNPTFTTAKDMVTEGAYVKAMAWNSIEKMTPIITPLDSLN